MALKSFAKVVYQKGFDKKQFIKLQGKLMLLLNKKNKHELLKLTRIKNKFYYTNF